MNQFIDLWNLGYLAMILILKKNYNKMNKLKYNENNSILLIRDQMPLLSIAVQ